MKETFNNFVNNFYEYITIEIYLKFLIIYFIFIWIAIFLWVYRDIVARTDSFLYQAFSLILILIFTPLGLIVYLIIRPGKTLLEKYRQEIDDNLDIYDSFVEKRLNNKNIISISKTEIHCHNCHKPVLEDFNFCPYCKEKLKFVCFSCKKIVRQGWLLCPYCGNQENDKK